MLHRFGTREARHESLLSRYPSSHLPLERSFRFPQVPRQQLSQNSLLCQLPEGKSFSEGLLSAHLDDAGSKGLPEALFLRRVPHDAAVID